MKEMVNFHGSDIEKVANYYGLKEENIHNFSGNVNPIGLSKTLEEKLKDNIHLVTSYPDPDYTKLKESVAAYTDSDVDYVLLGNGSTELIAHYIDYVNPQKTMIVGPTYSEYEKKAKTLNSDIYYFPLLKEDDFVLDPEKLIDECSDDIDLLVLCNPNNPTASLIASENLYTLFDYCKATGIYILVDETYMDFVENAKEISVLNMVSSYSNCIVLRGFSKFFAAPGLRLGYGITSDMNCHQSLEKQRHHWSINSLAAFAGKELMKDQPFISNSIAYITEERNRIFELLKEEADLKIYPTKANFFFIELLNPKHKTHALFEYLINRNLMVRNTASFPFLHDEYFRFCILTQKENTTLINAIKEYLDQ